ncbi:mediator of DNA damage checkpoint protein 1 [Oryctolagus cuniculus]|uniref:mediator of DNA damage checkpoint protein 1 n=1 Tax=Oryctolagus cuniculus TaxID=9986 RepID=UPI003879A838
MGSGESSNMKATKAPGKPSEACPQTSQQQTSERWKPLREFTSGSAITEHESVPAVPAGKQQRENRSAEARGAPGPDVPLGREGNSGKDARPLTGGKPVGRPERKCRAGAKGGRVGDGPHCARAPLRAEALLSSGRWSAAQLLLPLAPPSALPWGPNGPSRPTAAPPGRLPLADLEDHGGYRKSTVMSRKRSGLGRCRHFFWLGVVFDMVGAVMLFVGIFAELIFYDMLLYMGAIIIFLSLLWWVSWYTGNIELLPEETLGLTSQLASRNMVSALQQSVSHRFSWSMGTLSNSFLRIRRQRQRRRSWRTLQRTAAPGMTGTGQLEQEAEGDRDSDHCQAFCQGALSSTPEDEGSSESFGPPSPDSGPPWFDRQPLPHLVPPVLPLSTLDQPLPSTVSFPKSLPVVPLVSSTQNPAFSTCRSHPVISEASRSHVLGPMASQSHLQVPVASESQPVLLAASRSFLHVPGASQTHRLAPMDSQSHPLAPVYSQSHTLLPAASRSHLQVPVTSESQPVLLAASRSCHHVTRASQTHCLAPMDSQSHPLAPVYSQSHTLLPVASRSHLQVPVTSESQPVLLAASRSCHHVTRASQTHCLAPMDSQSHPLAPVNSQSHTMSPAASRSHLQVPVTSKSQPLPSAASQCHLQVPVTSKSQPLPSAASQCHLRVPVSSQSQPVVSVASQRQHWNFPLVSGPQPPPVQASGTQAAGTQVPVLQRLSDQAFQTVDPADSETGRALLPPPQATESICAVQEISLRQAAPGLEAPTEPLAQASETAPPPGQRPDTASPASEAAPPATPGQPFVPTETTPASKPKKKSHSV